MNTSVRKSDPPKKRKVTPDIKSEMKNKWCVTKDANRWVNLNTYWLHKTLLIMFELTYTTKPKLVGEIETKMF